MREVEGKKKLTSNGTPVFTVVTTEVRLAALELNGEFAAELQHALRLAKLEGVTVGCSEIGSVDSPRNRRLERH